jgi:hypothetical protein
MALGVAVSVGPAMADGPDGGSAGRDRAATIVQLTDGTELHTMDPRMLANLKEGTLVLVDFVHTEDNRNELNSITAVAPGASVDAPDATAFGE